MRKPLATIWVMCMSLFSLMAQQHSLTLVENRGQWPLDVVAACDVSGGKVFLEKTAITYHLFDLSGMSSDHDFDLSQPRIRGHVYRVNFIGSSQTNGSSHFARKKSRHTNFFLGSDSRRWAGNCSHYGEATLTSIYPGVNLKLNSEGPFLKYDFIVAPNSDPGQIRMQYEGHSKLSIENGRLIVGTSIGDVTEQKPIAWQIIDGNKKFISVRYVIENNAVLFEFPNGYDTNSELIIDPELVFSTYSGSVSNNFGYTATYDQAGALYSGSSAFGQNYPTTLGAYDVSHNGGASAIEQGIDIALSKYSPDGTSLLWSTFLGGSGDELPHSIIVNQQDELIVYGSTGSSNFPTTLGAIDNTFGSGPLAAPSGTGATFPSGTDIIIAHLNQSGSALIGSTYLGGSGNDGICDATALKYNYADEFRGEVELDADGNILIVSSTRSTNISTVNAVQSINAGGQDALIGKFNPQLTNILWLTFFGGLGDDSGFSIATNTLGEHFVCGGTTSNSLDWSSSVVQPSFGGIADAYILKLSDDGNSISAGTYWGGSQYDQAYFIETDNEENVYIFGQTANDDGLILNADYSNPNSGNLIAKFNSTLTNLVWSTVVGTGDNKPNLSPSAFLVDYCNRIYVSGWGVSITGASALNPLDHLHTMTEMPTTLDAFDTNCSSGDFYMAIYDGNMTSLEYATFFGGSTSSEHVDGGTSRFDKKGVIYQSVCAGCGGLDDFPISSPNVVSSVNGTTNGCNNGVFKFDFQLPLTAANFQCTPNECIGNTTSFLNLSSGAETYLWNFGDGTTSTEESPTHLYLASGTYTISLVVSSNNTCNAIDSTSRTITITIPEQVALADTIVCGEQSNLLSVPANEGTFSWSPTSGLSTPNASSTEYTGNVSQDFTITQNNQGCITTYELHVDVLKFNSLSNDSLLCFPDELILNAEYQPIEASISWSATNDWGTNDLLNDNESDSDISVSVSESSTYFVRIYQGECAIEDSVEVLLSLDSVLLGSDFTICPDDTVLLAVENPISTSNYSWTPASEVLSGQGTTAISILPTETTQFIVSSTNANGCISSDSIIVSISSFNPTNLVITQDTLLCVPAEVLLEVQFTPTNAEIFWSDSNDWGSNTQLNDDSTDENIIVQATGSQTYFVQVTSQGCVFEDNVNVQLANDQTSLAPDTLICFAETLIIGVEQPSSELNYSWTPAEIILTGQNTPTISASINETTTVIVSSLSEGGCVSEDSITIYISDLDSNIVSAGVNPTSVLAGQSAQLLANPSGYAYNWEPASSLNDATLQNPIATPSETTLYTLTVSDRECSFSDTVSLKVLNVICGPPNIYVPNAFTPNRDNKNEKLFVRAVNLQEMKFSIYNRWGQVVFTTTDQTIGWDGTFNGREVDPEVFVYYLDAICVGGETYFQKGNITVIR
jgi:gliding motility-associated-like protein